MNKIVMATTLVALLGLLGAPPAAADHCNGNVIDLGGVYIDDRGNIDGPWIYVEANGVPGYQSGGASLTGLYTDPCDHANPDQLIY